MSEAILLRDLIRPRRAKVTGFKPMVGVCRDMYHMVFQPEDTVKKNGKRLGTGDLEPFRRAPVSKIFPITTPPIKGLVPFPSLDTVKVCVTGYKGITSPALGGCVFLRTDGLVRVSDLRGAEITAGQALVVLVDNDRNHVRTVFLVLKGSDFCSLTALFLGLSADTNSL